MNKKFIIAWFVLFVVWFLGSFVIHGVLLRMAQGVRFGVAVALLTIVPTYMIYFVVQPMPAGLVIKQIVFDGALTVILGIIVARLFRDTSTPLRAG